MRKKELKIQSKTIRLFKKIAKIMSPPPVLTTSQWADLFRKLSPESSAEPGQWNTDRAPFQREIMDAINDPQCECIVIMSSAQVGKTEIILNIIGFYIDYDPSPVMVLQPTIEMAQTFSKDRLAPMLRDTPALQGKVKDAKSKDSENTILHKKFPGGHITMAGANSPSSLASRPIKIVLMDEIDRYPASAGSEGDPVKLAEKRTTTFWNRKKIKVSTPTIKGISSIEKEFESGSKEEWCLPCPCCKKYQPLEWGRIIFESVTMECKFCSERFTEREWKEGQGKYIAEHPDQIKVRSFHLNELASPWKSWDEVIADFKEAKDDFKKTHSIDKLKVWVNTSLGEPWEERGAGEAVEDEALIERREHYQADLPDGVLLLSSGIDVQDDRIEVEVVGWGKDFESWGIQYRKIYGDLEKDAIWNELEAYLDSEFHFSNGNSLIIAGSCIDTGGHFTTATYRFLKRMERKHKRIYGIKGMGLDGIPLIHKVSTNNSYNVKIFMLGVNAGKEMILHRLKIKEVGAGFCHFPSNIDRGYDESYLKGLNSERRILRYKDGRPVMKWVKKSGVRNEPLDLRNYALAAVEILKPNWNVLEQKISSGINYMKRQSQKNSTRRVGTVSRGIQI